MSEAREAARDMKRNALLDAATALLVEKPTASMNEIAAYAGIGIATLHRYVASREQLMELLCYRAIDVVRLTLEQVPFDKAEPKAYIPRLIEALIPLGDKINFLDHEPVLNLNEDLIRAENDLKQPVREAIVSLQQMGVIRSDLPSEWLLNVMYSMLFMTWQQVQDGHIARNSAASLMLDTLYNGMALRP